MKLTIRNKYLLLTLLVIINIAFRFPVTPHTIGTDSFYIFSIAESISTFGRASWILHPASFFGVYPFSYPSAFIFLLSGLSQVTGITIDYIILIIDMFLGVFACISMYVVAKEIWNDDVYAFLAAFAFSVSPNFLMFSMWEGSTRILFISILPLFLWILLKFKTSTKSIFFFGTLFFVLLGASHRMSFFVPIIIIAFFLVLMVSWIARKIQPRIKINTSVMQIHLFYILTIISFLLFSLQFLNLGPFKVIDYSKGFFFAGEDTSSSFLNLAADYVSSIGIILIFIIPGYIYSVVKLKKDFGITFILLTSIIFLPLLGYRNYSPLFVAPFFILLSTIGFVRLYRLYLRQNYIRFFGLSFFMIFTVFFAIFMMVHWNIYEGSTKESVYSAANSFKINSNGTSISNNGDLAVKITAYQANPVYLLEVHMPCQNCDGNCFWIC